MPKLKDKLNMLGFTPEEGRLAESVEGIVFIINHKVTIGTPMVGVTIEMLKNELNKNIDVKYSEELLKSTLDKCLSNYILAETNGKLYSITYYGK